ncbi:hypothetical protein DFH07DRAFT_961026 [Mycena maculata]|uniref:DUF6532 domain-containing protein n=1 Tax=Mycena maculata TaxID=230809 RepID=A0AAD7N9R6_9AGAR|nr:hypothetical protein DFH07DRAFT_961026 [Mycena maculata]
MSSPFTPAAFNANVVPVQGRGFRQSQVTEGRAEHDRKRKADAAAGQKRNETRLKNLAANAGLQPRLTQPHPTQPAPTQPAPTTTQQMVASSQTDTANAPTADATNTADTFKFVPPKSDLIAPYGYAYPECSPSTTPPLAAAHLAPSTQPSPPLPQLDWWNTLNPEAQARLLATLNRDAMATQGDAGLLGSDDSYGDKDPLNDIGTFPSLFAFSSDDATDYFDKDGDAQHEKDYEGDAESEQNYADPTWADPIPPDNDQNGSEPLPVSSLEFTTRIVEASHQLKRKIREPQSAAGKEKDGDTAANEAPSKKKKKASRSITALPEEHQKICERAFTLVKAEITLSIPFPVAGKRRSKADPAANNDDFAEIILRSFTNAAFDSGFPEAKPTRVDVALIRSRIPQFRSGIKKTAQLLVPETYSLKHISSLANPTTKLIATTIESNRKRVQEIVKTYFYKDPDNINVPETMFRNDIFQQVLNGYWFGEKEQDRAVYFKDKTYVELETLALIMVAVRCAIDEWTTGRWVLKVFSHSAYYTVYQKILGGLQTWKAHSDKQVSEMGAGRNLTLEALQDLLKNARSVSTSAVEAEEEEDEDDMFSMAAFEANAALPAPVSPSPVPAAPTT